MNTIEELCGLVYVTHVTKRSLINLIESSRSKKAADDECYAFGQPSDWQVSHHGNIFAPLPSGFWSYRVTSSAPMADGLYVAGPSVWNSLPDNLRNPIIGGNSFRQSLKTFLFSALEVSCRCAI